MIVKAIALDVDGVLTDGSFWWGEDGQELKRFHFADVMGISIGTRQGLIFTLISGENSPLVDRFAKKMNILNVYKGCKDKSDALRQFARSHNLILEEIAFMGDDINDLPALSIAGLAVAPANAVVAVKDVADLITTASGGDGAVRELIEYLLEQNLNPQPRRV